MVLGALGCMNNVDFEKISKWQHCARCVYYLSEITTRTSNLKNTALVLIDHQSYLPKLENETMGRIFEATGYDSRGIPPMLQWHCQPPFGFLAYGSLSRVSGQSYLT